MVWLVDVAKFPVLSAKSYCSYVAAVDKTLIFATTTESAQECNLSSKLEPSVRKGNFSVPEAIIINVINHLSTANIETKLHVPLSSIKKWKSALFQYIEFLDYYIAKETMNDDDQDEVVLEKSFIQEKFEEGDEVLLKVLVDLNSESTIDFIHTKEDLYANFRFRLITQDRFYDEIFYPISFIKRFFYLKGEKKFFDSWVESLIDKVTIFTEEDMVQLKQVHKLEISGGKILIHVNGSSKTAFTKKADNITRIPFSVTGLSKVALDHEKPLLKVMQENVDNLKTFQVITKELKKQITRKVNPKKLKKAGNLVLQSDFIQLIEIESLKSEMELLSSLTHLQLMDGRENRRKGVRG